MTLARGRPELHDLDPRTPVLIGAGQVAERIGDPYYTGLSPADLAGDAARTALFDATGAVQDLRPVAALATAIDVVAAVRLFEDSGLEPPTDLGRSTNLPRSIARRVGADPVRAVYEVGGGQSPQHLLAEFAAQIAAGRAQVVLLAGAEALSSVRHWRTATGRRPHWSENPRGALEDRGQGLDDMTSPTLAAHGLNHAPAAYALFENARRARLGQDRVAYAQAMGELFAPFSQVAASNPLSATRQARTAGELVTVTERNRVVADPYPRFLVARDQVNQGAATLLTSLGRARELGVAADRLVFCHGHADVVERDLLQRADLSASPAAVLAVRAVLEDAGIGPHDLDVVDLYSCFPIAVSNVADELFGHVVRSDPGRLTVTGGLPFFGGPGNDYSMHALAETMRLLRARPGTFGLVTANGGVLSKYSVGVYSSAPASWRPARSEELQARIDAWPAPPTTSTPNGPGRIETFTVIHDRDGTRRGVVVGRLDDGDVRFLARGADDPRTWALLDSDQPVGAAVDVTTSAGVATVRAI